MPIKPENKARYPANWKVIREAILSVGIWKAGVFFKLADSRHDADLAVDAATEDGDKVTEIVLTIAHLDHTPENCSPSNLMAMCQRHHLAYDQAHHTTNAYMTRKAKANTLELPL
jgi:hypothetical protein